VELSATLGIPDILTMTLLDLATVLAAAGRRAQAIEVAERARKAALAKKLRAHVRQVDALIADLRRPITA
jgi:pyruvate/2-oxoglutarate/acetoin dehydrogenase E1 component